MAKRKREEEEDTGGAPEWITTFVDMISLLVTFFILLLTFSSMDEKVMLKLQTTFSAYDRVVGGDPGDVLQEKVEQDFQEPTDPVRGARRRHSRPPEELVQNLEEMGQKETPDHQPLNLATVTDGLLITWDERSAFAPGSTALSQELQRSLGELGRVLEHYAFLVVVEGHGDGEEPVPRAFGSSEALSVARARVAAEHLLATSGLAPECVQIAGLGATKPRVENDSAVHRRTNRRVEVRVLSLSELLARSIDFIESSEGDR